VDLDEVVSMILVTGANVTLDGVDFIALGTSDPGDPVAADHQRRRLPDDQELHPPAEHGGGGGQKWIQIVGPTSSASPTTRSSSSPTPRPRPT
jgi:hypothetical protein